MLLLNAVFLFITEVTQFESGEHLGMSHNDGVSSGTVFHGLVVSSLCASMGCQGFGGLHGAF